MKTCGDMGSHLPEPSPIPSSHHAHSETLLSLTVPTNPLDTAIIPMNLNNGTWLASRHRSPCYRSRNSVAETPAKEHLYQRHHSSLFLTIPNSVLCLHLPQTSLWPRLGTCHVLPYFQAGPSWDAVFIAVCGLSSTLEGRLHQSGSPQP